MGRIVHKEFDPISEHQQFTTEDILWTLGIWSVILTLSPVIIFYLLIVGWGHHILRHFGVSQSDGAESHFAAQSVDKWIPESSQEARPGMRESIGHYRPPTKTRGGP